MKHLSATEIIDLHAARAAKGSGFAPTLDETVAATRRGEAVTMTIELPESFCERVMERTGVSLAEIPDGIPNDLLGGSIVCARGATYVVTAGYPDAYDDEGDGLWTRPESYRVVDRSKDLPSFDPLPGLQAARIDAANALDRAISDARSLHDDASLDEYVAADAAVAEARRAADEAEMALSAELTRQRSEHERAEQEAQHLREYGPDLGLTAEEKQFVMVAYAPAYGWDGIARDLHHLGLYAQWQEIYRALDAERAARQEARGAAPRHHYAGKDVALKKRALEMLRAAVCGPLLGFGGPRPSDADRRSVGYDGRSASPYPGALREEARHWRSLIGSVAHDARALAVFARRNVSRLVRDPAETAGMDHRTLPKPSRTTDAGRVWSFR